MRTFQPDLLAGRVAVVTGASKGIGFAIARGFAAAGARVVVSSRNQDACENAALELRAAGGEACGIAAHTGDGHALAQLVDETVRFYGRLDVVVNNAAANPVFGPTVGASDEAFDKIMAVNVKGPFALARAAYPHLRRNGGAVVNVASIGGLRPEEGLGLYSVSKAALISLTKVLAREWGPDGIRVNCICPGLVKTKFSRALWEDEASLERFVSRTPLGRMAEPDEIAPLAVLLASPHGAGFATGGVYTLDGGITI